MALRFQALGRVLRLTRALDQMQQVRRQSIFSDFQKKLKEEIESNPSLKQSVDELKQTTESLKERTKAATETLSKAASASVNATKATTQEVSSRMQDSFSRVSEGVKGDAQELKDTAAKTGSQMADAVEETAASAEASTVDSQQAAQDPSSQGAGSWHAEGIGGTTGAEQEPGQAQGAGAAAGKAAGTLGLMERLRTMASVVQREVAAAVLPDTPTSSATRAYDESLRSEHVNTSGGITIAPETRWQKQWKDMQDKLGGHPLFQRMASFRNARVFSRGKEVADDLRERWETSESPLVHRIQDMTENFSVETETAKTVKEMRARDPAFDMIKFLRALKQDVKPVIQAYLRADEKVLAQHCTPEAVERLSSIVKAEHALVTIPTLLPKSMCLIDRYQLDDEDLQQDRYADTNMLDISDVELHDLQLFEGDPVVVVRFNAQQINCFRDKFENVVDGSPDDVHRVVYVWALRQGKAGFVGKDGRLYPPQWQINEMAIGIAQKLL